MTVYDPKDNRLLNSVCLIVRAKHESCGFLIPINDDESVCTQLDRAIKGRTEYESFEFSVINNSQTLMLRKSVI